MPIGCVDGTLSRTLTQLNLRGANKLNQMLMKVCATSWSRWGLLGRAGWASHNVHGVSNFTGHYYNSTSATSTSRKHGEAAGNLKFQRELEAHRRRESPHSNSND